MMTPKEHLFVYGTLRRAVDRAMSALLAQYAELIGLGLFQGQLYDVGSYPGVIPSVNPADVVIGEIYRLHDREQALKWLDEYESYQPDQPEQSLYLRQKVSIVPTGGQPIQAWIYLYNRPTTGLKRIESGDYWQYLSTTPTHQQEESGGSNESPA